MIHGKVVISRNGTEIKQLSGMQTQSMKERLCGLLVLDELTTEQALWICPCNSVHTVGMRYVLDLVYVDKHNKVCALVEKLKPWRMSMSIKAKVTMEVPAGSIELFDIQLGDECIWQD